MKKIKEIIENHNPVSIFLYGSKARGDDLPESDLEIGVFTKGRRPEDSKAFYFNLEDFKEGEIDTPFPTDIYLRELSLSGKTVYGEEIVESFEPPSISTSSILERINFDCATALYGFKMQDEELFYKATLFGVRNLIILEIGKFPLTYRSISKVADTLNLKEFSELPRKAYETRMGNYKPQRRDFIDSITFTNYLIRRRIKKEKQRIIIE